MRVAVTDQTEAEAGRIAAAFAQAIALGAAQEGATAPNPAVGCVLLDAQGAVLVAAAHLGAGQPHAEARAIAMARAAGVEAAIHTAVVTLEPCNHTGRTGPCSEALLATPVRVVWYALPDPNLPAAGGADRLRAAGLAVHALAELPHPARDDLLAKARRLLAPFASRVQRGRPFVTVKQALNAQGSMIPPAGQKTFTTAASLLLAHQLRRRADAILTGSGTVLADTPSFTVRHLPDIAGKIRHLSLLDRRGRIAPAYLDQARANGFIPHIETDLTQALQALAALGCNEVLIEAGPALTQAVRELGLWDEWVLIQQTAAGDTVTTTRNL